MCRTAFVIIEIKYKMAELLFIANPTETKIENHSILFDRIIWMEIIINGWMSFQKKRQTQRIRNTNAEMANDINRCFEIEIRRWKDLNQEFFFNHLNISIRNRKQIEIHWMYIFVVEGVAYCGVKLVKWWRFSRLTEDKI